MPDRLPDFLGIGTQKGGTTSLHKWLCQHHDVYMPHCKEVHYFDLNYKESVKWYSKHFEGATKNQICGEITPFYLFHPDVPKRIKSTIPEVKLIVLLRDPVERTISQIYHAKQRGFEQLEPIEALKLENSRLRNGGVTSLQKHSYVGRSKYLEQLDRYEAIFPQKQMVVLKSESLFNHPEENITKLREFIGIETIDNKSIIPKANKSRIAKDMITEELRDALRKELLETAIGIQKRYGFGWDWAL